MDDAKRIARMLCSFLPTRVPRDQKALDAWISDVLDLAGLEPTPDSRFAVAAIVQQMLQNGSRLSKRLFVRALHTAQAQKAAFNIMQEIKLAEKAANEAKQNADS